MGQLQSEVSVRDQEDTPVPLVPSSLAVVLLHGIRTEGAWQEMIATVLRANGTRPIPLKYGFFDLLRFLTPGLRERPIRRIHDQLMNIKDRNPHLDLVVVAHSFGTYIITRLLRAHPYLRLKRLALCGSIVRRDFEWAQIQDRIEEEVLNDCGTHDIWPVLAQSVTWGYGASGTFGFGTFGVRDRYHKYSHSEFFNPDFAKKYWVPFILNGSIADSPDDIRSPPPWWQSALAVFPLRYVILIILATILALFARGTRTATNGVTWDTILAKEVLIEGRVVNSSSQPVAGARVMVDTDYRSDSTRTSATGRFSLILLGTPGSTAIMRVEKDRYAPYSAGLIVPPRRRSAAVVLQPLPISKTLESSAEAQRLP